MAGISVDIGDDTGVIVELPNGARPKPPPAPASARPAPPTVAEGSAKVKTPPIPATQAQGKRKARRAPTPPVELTEQATRIHAPRRISVAWLLLILVLGAGGVAGYYVFERWQTAVDALGDARGQAREANGRAAAANQRALEARAAAARAETETEKLRATVTGAEKRGEEADELAGRLQALVGEQGTVVRDNDKLTLEMVDKVLFRSGQAVLTEKGEEVLTLVGDELKKLPEKQIWVQGHTDDLPIANDLFASNWELSTARALTVVHYLEDVSAIDPRRLAVVGFGEHRPVSRNKRFRNRRIEIVLFPREVRLIKE